MARGKKSSPPRSISAVKRAFEKRDNKRAAKIVAEYRKFVPALKKYGRRRTYTKSERQFIQRIPKILRFTDHLFPVTEKQAKKFEDQLFVPVDIHGEPIRGLPKINAIQFRNTGKDVAIHTVADDLLMATNGRNYVYWKLDRVSVAAMKKAGTEAFQNFRNAFPAEKIARLAEKAFKQTRVKAVYLWGSRGRCNQGFRDLRHFLKWLFEEYAHYVDADQWVNGIVLAV
jgi:hypothetical protein